MTEYYAFDDTKQDGSKLHGGEWDALTRIVDSQLQGALALHGPGVAAIPDLTSLLVEEDAGGVILNPGACVLLHSTKGHVFARVPQTKVISGADFPNQNSGQNFVHVALRVALTSGAPDTREDATPVLALSTFDSLDGHELLAQVTLAGGVVTDVVDRRRFLPGLSKNALWSLFFGAGRITGSDRTSGAAVKVPGQLRITLPAGSSWFIEGQFILLGDDVEIDVPDNEAAGVWGVLSIDDAGLPTVADDDWLSVAPARGVGVVGLVKTSATEVLSIEESTRDIIQPEPAKQARFEAIEDLIAQLSGETDGGGGGGGGTGDVTLAMWNALKGRVDALELELAALKKSLGVDSPIAVRLAGRVETLRAEHSRLAASVVRNSPRTAGRLSSAVVVAGLSGIEENLVGGTQRAHYIGGNLKVNRAKRRLE
jgi:hypothetical protein